MSLLKNCRVGQAGRATGAMVALLVAGPALAGVKIEHIRNGSASSPTNPPAWVTGNAGQSNAHFLEGQSMAYRILIDGLTPGPTVHFITIEYDILTGGKHALDYVTHYNRIDTPPHNIVFGHPPETIDPLGPSSNLPAGPFVLGPGFLIPPPPELDSGQPTASFNLLPMAEKLLTIYNGTITAVEYPDSGHAEKNQMKISFTASSANVIILFGGHIASQADWGPGNSAPFINGSSYHMRLAAFSGGSVGNQDLSLSTNAVVLPPTCSITGADSVCPGTTNGYSGPNPPSGFSFSYDWEIVSACGATFVGGGSSATGQNVSVVACATCGTYTLNLEVTSSGQTANCSMLVQVEVDTPINIVACPPNPAPVSCAGSLPTAYTTVGQFTADGGVISNTCGPLSISHIDTPLGGTCGTITRTYTITDVCGNTDTCTQTITVNDNVGPVLSGCPGQTVVNIQCASQIPAAPTVTASDNCDGSVQVNLQVTDVGSGCPGSTRVITRTWTATDSCGNTSTCTQTINLVDNTQPVLNGCPSTTLNLQCVSQVPAPPTVTATDNCSGSITPVFNQSDNGGSGCASSPLIITRTWTATDSCGNSSSCTQTITVIDNVDPEIECPPDADVECGEIGADPATTVEEFEAQGGTVSDNCGAVTITWLGDEQISEGAECPITFERTYEATDSCGNTAQCVQTIRLIDTSPPVQCCVVPEIIGCVGFPITVPPPVVTDECGLTITPVAVRSDGLSISDPFPAGATTVTWTSTDGCGNESDEIVVTVIMNECETYRTKSQSGWASTAKNQIADLLSPGNGGDIVVGRTNDPARSMSISAAAAQCVKDRLPGSGGNPTFPANFGNQALDAGSCNTTPPMPLTEGGQFENSLLANTIALTLNLRYDAQKCNGALGSLELCSVMTTIKTNGSISTYVLPESVLVAMGSDRSVNRLLALANDGLAGRSIVPTTRGSINTAVNRVNTMFNNSACVALLSTNCGGLLSAPVIAGGGVDALDAAFADAGKDGSTDPILGDAAGRNASDKGGVVNSGVMTPTSADGVMLVEGDYTQTATGLLLIELRGQDADTRCDLLDVQGEAFLHGTLVVDVTNDFVPNVGEEFEVVTADGLNGTFENLLLADLEGDPYLDVRYTPTSVMVDVKSMPVIEGDVDRNGRVDVADLLLVLRDWGSAKSSADVTGDGVVDTSDIIRLLGNWGSHSSASP